MTRTTMMTIIAAAAMTVAAHAQEMKANIPFDFTVAGTRLASGAYTVKQHSTPGAYVLRGASSRQGVIATAGAAVSYKESGSAKLVFKCWSSGCSLAEVHQPGVWPRQFRTKAPKNGETERTVAVQLTSSTSASGF